MVSGISVGDAGFGDQDELVEDEPVTAAGSAWGLGWFGWGEPGGQFGPQSFDQA